MGEQAGGLEVALNAITVGVRHRKDVGDLEPLMASIAKYGLLQPITVTPELVLVCGWRRLQAMLRLGWTHTRPWWRPGLSEGASRVLAEHDENFLRQAYTKSEQATLYRELKDVLAQEAARRKAAHWFSPSVAAPDGTPGSAQGSGQGASESDNYGSADSAVPEDLGEPGDTRAQAAQLVSGRKAHQSLQRISTLMDVAAGTDQPQEIRAMAAEAVVRIDDGHPVQPEWERVQQALAALDPTPADSAKPAAPTQTTPQPVAASPISRAAHRAWVMTWRGTAALLAQHDPTVLGPVLAEADWQTVCDLHTDLGEFLDEARTARMGAGLETTPDDGSRRPSDSDQADGSASAAADDPSAVAEARPLAAVVPIGVRS